MLFLVESHNTGDPTPHLEAEGAAIAELQRAGIVEHIFLKADLSGAVLLLRAPDLAAARDAINGLPLVVNKLTSPGEFVELTELDPTHA